METNPRLWTYSSSNSPLQLPSSSILFTQRQLIPLEHPEFQDTSKVLSREDLMTIAQSYQHENRGLDQLLQENNAPLLSERFPILLAGECANPYRLQDMMMGPLPLLFVRLEHLCRTWADSLDAREVKPGIHHVTLARSEGWWEPTLLGLATRPQMKQILEWLNEGNRDAWKPMKLDEGALRFETNRDLPLPTSSDLTWDGEHEKIATEMPLPNGPSISMSDIFVPIHVRLGCYNNRGRLARCLHINQRDFHEKLFRRGSSFKWNELLSTK
jgi:hypothetical protein